MPHKVHFPSGTVNYYFRQPASELALVCDMTKAVFITDEHIAALYPDLFSGKRALVLPAGEDSKDIATIVSLTGQLLKMEAGRDAILVGLGGGVITDITGFLGSVYMRGVRFGFVPTSLLGMVDAAIGGKNGVNTGLHKNMLGTIRQPDFIFYDSAFLHTLPDAEWSNGFAEVIKYACIFDAALFEELSGNDINFYKNDTAALDKLIARCAGWKNKTVAEDEQEQGIRKLLNFGHTVGHAIEKLYGLSHGQAVAIGMVAAARISDSINNTHDGMAARLKELLVRYELPVHISMNVHDVMHLLRSDKKRAGETINYILLKTIGHGIIYPLPLAVIEKALTTP